MKLVDLISDKKKYYSTIVESIDDKFVSIGYGRYKLKGQEDNKGAAIYKKTETGQYVKADQDGSAGGGAGKSKGDGSMEKDEYERFVNETPNWSSQEAKLHLDKDIKDMSNILGKASHQIIKIMMDGVKGGRYDALDIQRGIETGPMNRTHEGERPFMKMLWNKVRDGFRRYSPKQKLRK